VSDTGENFGTFAGSREEVLSQGFGFVVMQWIPLTRSLYFSIDIAYQKTREFRKSRPVVTVRQMRKKVSFLVLAFGLR
jgi:hypothetical protein